MFNPLPLRSFTASFRVRAVLSPTLLSHMSPLLRLQNLILLWHDRPEFPSAPAILRKLFSPSNEGGAFISPPYALSILEQILAALPELKLILLTLSRFLTPPHAFPFFTKVNESPGVTGRPGTRFIPLDRIMIHTGLSWRISVLPVLHPPSS